ncbi:MAG: hypothetical protein ACLQO1_01320 [Steroidobacteraceae bacterium]
MAKNQDAKTEITIPRSEIGLDDAGNLVIKNKELSKKMRRFLGSAEGKKLVSPEYSAHLLCCTLRLD